MICVCGCVEEGGGDQVSCVGVPVQADTYILTVVCRMSQGRVLVRPGVSECHILSYCIKLFPYTMYKHSRTCYLRTFTCLSVACRQIFGPQGCNLAAVREFQGDIARTH